jgi:hypothetical protein
MAAVFEGGNYKNISATAAVTANPCQLLGFYVNSTSSGTLVLRDGGSGGTVMSGTITPAIGFHRFPATVGDGGLHATIGSTLNITLFYVPAAC